MQSRASSEGAGTEGAMERDEVEAIEVHIPEIGLCADLMVEQRQLDSQIAQQPADLVGELLAVADLRPTVRTGVASGSATVWR
jgi:hypothetical protein